MIERLLDIDVRRSWLTFLMLGIFSTLVSFGLGPYLVFKFWLPLLWLVTILWGIRLMVGLIRDKRQSYWLVSVVPLVILILGAFFVLAITLYPAYRTCALTGLTVAHCKDNPESYADAYTLETPLCEWDQRHVLGLVLVGERFDDTCAVVE